uniref:Uncharacterized protein n=1 Tax=Ditylenchus dipsaci TaxID=166011 RepID=A0A915DDC1_9BILA
MSGWYETMLLSITSISVILQAYVFVLIFKVSPKSMTTYCFFLICYTFWDLSFTIILGYGIILDMQAPTMCGGYVNGFAKYFGSNGGNTAISVMAFCAAALIYYMLYGLSYRYLAVQTDRSCTDLNSNSFHRVSTFICRHPCAED